nr:hypothetical protein CFP56_37301 [Quercus suber]
MKIIEPEPGTLVPPAVSRQRDSATAGRPFGDGGIVRESLRLVDDYGADGESRSVTEGGIGEVGCRNGEKETSQHRTQPWIRCRSASAFRRQWIADSQMTGVASNLLLFRLTVFTAQMALYVHTGHSLSLNLIMNPL